MTVIPALGRWRQEDQKLESIFRQPGLHETLSLKQIRKVVTFKEKQLKFHPAGMQTPSCAYSLHEARWLCPDTISQNLIQSKTQDTQDQKSLQFPRLSENETENWVSLSLSLSLFFLSLFPLPFLLPLPLLPLSLSDRVSLHSPCYPRTHYVYQTGIRLRESCLSLQLMYWECKGLCHNTWPNNAVFRETLPNDTYWGLRLWLSGRVVSTVYKKLIPSPSQQQQEDTYLNIYGYCEAIFKIQGWR